MAEEPRWTPVGAPGDWVPGQGRLVQVGARRVAVFRDGDAFHAIKDACPHAGVSLARGRVVDGEVFCPAHNWAFRLADGVCVSGDPGCRAIVLPVRLNGDRVEVGV